MGHLLRTTGEAAGGEIPVDRDYLIIGRDPSACHVLLDEDVVSRRHAALEHDGQGNVTIVNLASTNGTFVNGAAVSRQVLRDGDTISLGPVGQVDLRYSVAPAGQAHEPVNVPTTGEQAVSPSHGGRGVPAETVPLASFAVPSPFSAAEGREMRIDEGQPGPVTCATCASSIEPGGGFCSSCGAPAAPATPIRCPQCGKTVGAGAKFCKYCAHKLSGPASGTGAPTHVSAPVPPAGTQAASPQFAAPTSSLGATLPGGVGGQHAAVAPLPYTSMGPAPEASPGGFTNPVSQNIGAVTHATPRASSGGGSLLTPTGAGIAAVCFFLPWVQFSCGGYSRRVSGADIAGGDSSLWIVFGAAVVIIGAYLVFKAQRRVAASRPITILSSLAGAALLIFKGIEFSQPQQTMFGRISPQDLGLSIQPGALGTLAGFGLAFLGALLTRAAPDKTAPAARVASATAAVRPNVVGLLCYAGLPLLGILWVAAAAALLAAEPYKRDRFVRFHVFQTLFLGAALFALTVFFVLVGMSAGLLVFMAGVGPSAFLAYKAYANETPRLPLVGDLAARLAGQAGDTPR
jgi:uncharacterized membrane protein